MRATTPLLGWPNDVGTFTLIHTTAGTFVRSIVLKPAPLGKMAKTTLDFTEQSIVYTDAPRRMILPHSGGLANSNFFLFRR